MSFDLHALRDKDGSPISMGGIVPNDTQSDGVYKLQCFPLFTLLLALGNPRVEYFILDIEGAERQVREEITQKYFNTFNICQQFSIRC